MGCSSTQLSAALSGMSTPRCTGVGMFAFPPPTRPTVLAILLQWLRSVAQWHDSAYASWRMPSLALCHALHPTATPEMSPDGCIFAYPDGCFLAN